jgi:hypothetical protein
MASRNSTRLIAFSIALIIGSVAPQMVRADLIQLKESEGGNGHYYGLIMPDSHADSYSWTDARASAASMKFEGMRGYLATVTSAAESEFLRSNFFGQLSDDPANSKYAWIGLFAPTPTSAFQWVTGETLSYTNWAPSEPNFFGTPLWQYVHYWTRDFGAGPTWTWNNEQDLPGRNTYGFFVEFGGGQDLGAGITTPEPSSIMVASLCAVVGLIWLSWRTNRAGGLW